MKCEKIFIFICVIICLFTISGVCAEDVNQTEIGADNINQELGSPDVESSQDDIASAESSGDAVSLNDNENIASDKNATVIVASDLTTDYNKHSYLVATLKNTQDKPVAGAVLNTSLYNKNYTTDSMGQIKVPTYGFNAKTYDVCINFAGNENYSPSSKTVKITVNKIDSTLAVANIDNLNYGEVVKTTAGFDGASAIKAYIGERQIEVNGKTISIPVLDAGKHTLTVTTVPDENHNAVTKTATVTVNKVKPSLNIENVTMNYGDTKNFTFDSKISSKIKAKIADKEIHLNGNVLTISGLDAGVYDLYVEYGGDANYLPANKTAKITVNKIDSQTNVGGLNNYPFDYGRTYKIPLSASGAEKITAKIDGKDVEMDGNSFIIEDLDAGTHTISVTTVPDKNHNAVTETVTITIKKINPVLNLRDVSEAYGHSLRIGLNVNNGVKYTAKIGDNEIDVEGNVLHVPKLNAGNYTLTVTTLPDKNYNSVTRSSQITIYKAKTETVTSDLSVHEGNKTYLSASIKAAELLNDGLVSFYVGETNLGHTILDNGIAKLSYTPEKAGTYTVLAVFSGSSNFNASSSTFKLTVLAKPANQNSTGDNKTSDNTNQSQGNSSESKTTPITDIPSLEGVSGNGSVDIKFPADATGTVTLTVDNRDYVFDVKNGIAEIAFPDIANGDYPYTLTYSGDGKYSSFSDKGTLKISKTDANQTLDNSSAHSNGTDPSKDGADEKLTIDLPDDASGSVTVIINGSSYVFPVRNGVCNIELPDDFENGNYPYTIKFNPSKDSNYSSVTKSGTLKVNGTKSDSGKNSSSSGQGGIAFSDLPSFDGLSGDHFDVKLPNDAKGTVTLTVDNKQYEFDVKNGAANVKMPEDLADGNYPFTIAYSGDAKYKPFSKNGSININRVQSSYNKLSLVLSNTKVTYASGSYFTIKVYQDSKPVNGFKMDIKINGKNFKTLTTKNGDAKFKVTQKPGKYQVTIVAAGHILTQSLKVKHIVTLKKVAVKKSAKKLVLTASLAKVNKKYLKNKKITFKFNGKKYTAKTNKKGVAKVTVKSAVLKKLKVGKKVTYQATYLKDTVKKTVKIKK